MNKRIVPYKHFIITLFNLPLWKLDKNNMPTLTNEWLENRLNLFEKYCFPSVKAQTNQNFIWICLCDKATSEPYMSKIMSYREKYDLFFPYFLDLSSKDVNGVKDLEPFIRPIIKEYITKDDQFVVTTNLDNDDSISSQMIDKIQSLIDADCSNRLYSFNWGYQYFTDINLILKMKYPHNHFLTLVEDLSSFTTIVPNTHTKARKKFEVVDIKEQPYWIEFIHDSNQNNDLRITSRITYVPVFKSIDLNTFGLDICLKWYNQLFYILLYFPFKWIKRACNRIVRKLKRRNPKQ